MTDFLDDGPERRKRWPWAAGAAALVVAIVIGVVVANGSAGSDGADGATDGPEGDPVTGGSLVYSETYPVLNFQSSNYSTMAVLSAVSDRLVYIPEESNEVEPYLAESWEVSDDGLRYDFTLRDGVTFSDGTALTAQVVVDNIEQLALGNEEKGAPARSTLAQYESAEVEDELHFSIILSSPSYLFLRSLAHPQAGIVSASTLELPYEEQRSFEEFVGSGAFVVDSSVAEQEITLKKRADYAWAPQSAENQGAAYLDSVTIKYIEEPGLREGAVTSGQVDLARGIQPSDEQSVTDAGYSTYAVQTPIHTVNTTVFRVQNEEISDEGVRQALQIGFDRDALVSGVLSDSYYAATDYFGHLSDAYHDNSELLAYDPDRANELLDEAGWTEKNADGIRVKDGETLTLTASASAQSVAIKPALDFVADQWREIGVELVNLAGDTTAYDQSLTDFETYQLYGSRNLIDSELSGWSARQGYEDDELESLAADVLGATSEAEYQDATAAWSQYVLGDGALAIALFEEAHVFGASPSVHFAVDGHILPQFQSIWVGES